MMALGIDAIHQLPRFHDGWLVVGPRWLTAEDELADGDLILGVDEKTADLIHYYFAAHLAAMDDDKIDASSTIGMAIGNDQKGRLFQIRNGEQESVTPIDLSPILFANIVAGEMTDPDSVSERVYFIDPPDLIDRN